MSFFLLFTKLWTKDRELSKKVYYHHIIFFPTRKNNKHTAVFSTDTSITADAATIDQKWDQGGAGTAERRFDLIVADLKILDKTISSVFFALLNYAFSNRLFHPILFHLLFKLSE